MSKDKISDYSATANSNTDIGGINIDEGCAPSGINDAIRTLMKQLKDWQSGSQDVYIHPAGSASAPSITATGDTNTGIFFPAADTVGIATGGTERLRLDSSGNLGLGVTPNTGWAGGFSGNPALQIKTGSGAASFIGSGTDNLRILNNAYYDGTWKRIGAGYASQFQLNGGAYEWYTAGTSTAGNAITFTQAMTLDASGNLGVGNTSPSSRLDVTGVISLQGTTLPSAGTARIFSRTSDSSTYIQTATSGTFYLLDGSQNTMASFGSSTLTFSTGNTERARIDSSGNLLVATTGTTGAQGFAVLPYAGGSYTRTGHTTSASSGDAYAQFYYNSGSIGSITQNGTTGVLYNLTSDYRLKNNPTPITGAKEFVMALQPKTWDWWDGSGKGVGFIAHEFMEVAKHSGHGEKDAVDEDGNPVYQSIQPSSSEVMANLVAHIQELETRLAALENK